MLAVCKASTLPTLARKLLKYSNAEYEKHSELNENTMEHIKNMLGLTEERISSI